MENTKNSERLNNHLITFEKIIKESWTSIRDYIEKNHEKDFKTIAFIQISLQEMISLNWDYLKTNNTTILEKNIKLMNLNDIHKSKKKLQTQTGTLSRMILQSFQYDPNETLIIITHINTGNKPTDSQFGMGFSRIHTFKLDNPFVGSKMTQIKMSFPPILLEKEKKYRKEWVEQTKKDILNYSNVKDFKFPSDITTAFDNFIEKSQYEKKIIMVGRLAFVLFEIDEPEVEGTSSTGKEEKE